VSTVLQGTSATNKPRVGRWRIIPGRAPLVPRTESRSHLVIRRPAGPCGSAITSRRHYGHVHDAGTIWPDYTAAGRATIPPRDSDDHHHGHLLPPGHVSRLKVCHDSNLKATCPGAGVPLGEEVNDRPRFLDS